MTLTTAQDNYYDDFTCWEGSPSPSTQRNEQDYDDDADDDDDENDGGSDDVATTNVVHENWVKATVITRSCYEDSQHDIYVAASEDI